MLGFTDIKKKLMRLKKKSSKQIKSDNYRHHVRLKMIAIYIDLIRKNNII